MTKLISVYDIQIVVPFMIVGGAVGFCQVLINFRSLESKLIKNSGNFELHFEVQSFQLTRCTVTQFKELELLI